VAIVDAADASSVLQYKWHAKLGRQTTYARRNARRPDGTYGGQTLHQFLTGYELTDHRNGDGLDNRRANLRAATPGENGQNCRKRPHNTSGFKGVTWHKHRHKWMAQIKPGGGKNRCLGYFLTAEEAAYAYDAAARELHGEYAAVNFPLPGERAA
jgi:hypothetical protein